MGELYNELAFLVLLTALKGMFIFPTQCGFAVFTVDVCHCVKACEQNPLLCRTTSHVHHRVEQICSALTSLKGLGDELVMVGEVSSAVDAAVGAVAAGQVRLESFGARHGDHGPGRRAVQEGAAGPGRLTREAPQHTGEGRGGAGWEVYTFEKKKSRL